MSNIVPEKVIDFRIYKGGADLLGVADVQLPSIEPMTETVKGAGIAGEVETPTMGHTGSLKLTINWRSITADLLCLLEHKAHELEARGAIQVYNAGSGECKVSAIRVVMRGFTTKGDPGKLEVGANSDGSTEHECVYLKYVVDGKTVVEIDKFNFKYVVNGQDALSAVRQALGLM